MGWNKPWENAKISNSYVLKDCAWKFGHEAEEEEPVRVVNHHPEVVVPPLHTN